MGEGTTGASQTRIAKAAGKGTGGPASGRIKELEPELERIAEASGCELVHAELKGGTLRLFLDKPSGAPLGGATSGGVTLSDCEHVSKQVSAWLDVVDFGKSRYVLEVSSPGLDRQLYRSRDYARFVGRKVRVTLEDPETGRRRTVVGRLESFERPEPLVSGESGETAPEEDARVVVIAEPKGERLEVGLRDIRQARLEIEL